MCRTSMRIASLQGIWTATIFILLIMFGPAWTSREAHAQVGAAESAVVLVYQRFGEDDNPGNSVKLAEFEAHIEELTSGKYNVMPLPDILAAIRNQEPLPNRTVAITIDDTFRSVYEEAWPRLKRAALPFTLFVSTDPSDLGPPAYMTWDEIRELRNAGVTIGAHTASHMQVSESTTDDLRVDVERSLESFMRELGERPTIFSWPLGEMSAEASRMLEELGFEAAFGYHSGTVNILSDSMMLPRFPMVGSYGSKKEFELRVNTLALPLTDIEPDNPLVTGDPPKAFAFKIHPAVGRIRGFNCFHSKQGQLTLTQTGERSFSASLDDSAMYGTWRINCTMPTGGKRFRWWGMQFYSAR